MSTNIEVTRKCEYCGKNFIAKTTKTRYCNHSCNSKHYKLRERERKIEQSNAETKMQVTEPAWEEKVSGDILNVKETAKILKATVFGVYAMINSGRLKATRLSPRNIRIMRSDLEAMFMQPEPEHIPTLREHKIHNEEEEVLIRENCFSVSETVTLFGKTREDIYTYFKRNNVPKLKIGKEVFFSKLAVDKLYKKSLKPKVLGLENERKANRRLADEPLEKKDCYSVRRCEELLGKDRSTLYSFFKRRNTPKLRIGQEVYFSKVVVNKIVRTLKEKEEQ